ncbi:proton-coupled folate transporter-like isoform X2 [Condylostylus longicornis]|uniref:proton-coupled folate transporter-like isoform X2 n=1 Tax=Condylostylus longicornis TaxID=2530218 RepID=UPI00244E43D9|nr:proton-coupled folate transporter-like isoform X2 [Condylostylus longicornis]
MEPVNITSTTTASRFQRNKMFRFLLEPAVFLIFFGIYLSATVFQTHLMQETCKNIFKFNSTDCDKLGTEEIESDSTKAINLVTQPYVAKIFMVKSIMESVVPAIDSLFVGPWSDKFGRKPVIITGLVGYFLSFTILSVITLFSLSFVIYPWYYIIVCLPVLALGGICCLISGILCYIADVCKQDNLAFRLVTNEASIFLGSFCGNLLTVFLAILYVIFFVKEGVHSNGRTKTEMFYGLFDFSLVKEMLSTCFERRANYDRAIIWLTMLSSVITIFIMEGSGTVMYLFALEKFNWTITEYTRYDAIAIANLTIGNVFGVYIMQKIFKFSVTTLALLGIASAVLDSVVKATATYSWEMYLAMALGMLRGIAGPMKRAILSHVAPQHDLGKIMSFTVSLESVSTLAAAPLYTFIYTSTIQTYCGAFNFFSTALYFICYIFISTVYGIQKVNSLSSYETIS